MGKLKEIFSSWKIWLVIIALLLSWAAISPNPWASGVKIISIDSNSSASANDVPVGAVINSVNGIDVRDINDYSDSLSNVKPGDIIKLSTNKGDFSLLAQEKEGSVRTGLSVINTPTSNLKKGLDLAGGVRVLLQPEETATKQQVEDILDITSQRLNVYGLADVNVRQVDDMEGNTYILVEVPGANKEEVAKLISQQGKFEAKIGEDTVFSGGEDIKNVDRSQFSGIDPNQGCGQTTDGTWSCRFRFRIDISQEAAKRHASVTKDLEVVTESDQQFLSKKLDFYLDDKLADSLYISADLKGSDTTTISIQGPGFGATKQEAMYSALSNMRNMQTILITGSLPVKINIAKIDVISPTLGDDFLQTTLLAAIIAIIAVGAVLFVRFRNLRVSGSIMFTGVCEIIIILGVAAAINWRLDLAAIAGILAAIGTGVDDQIVITDEALRGESQTAGWKERMKRAFFIIFGAYFTTVVAMLPLGWMGAGLVRGFAITTIIGVTVGVFVTRPAYAQIAEVFLKK